MKSSRAPFVWIAVALVAGAFLVWSFPRAFPRLLPHWKVTRAEAESIAREEVALLGELPVDPYVVAKLKGDPALEFRLLMEPKSPERDRFDSTRLAKSIVAWEVTIYAPGWRTSDWSYQALPRTRNPKLPFLYSRSVITLNGVVNRSPFA